MIGAILLAALTFAASEAAAQSLTLEYEQVVTRAIPGATAAFSLDPSRVGASAQDGLVTLAGRGPGVTSVIVVASDRTETIQVTVAEPPVIFRPGLIDARANGAEWGQYEVRFGSDPRVLQGTLQFSRREGDRSTELTFGGASALDSGVDAPFGIPLASYTRRSSNSEITLLDRTVANSPLTVTRSNIRGVHLRAGALRLHAGYSFFGNFEHLLLPTTRERIVGLGYQYRINSRSSLTPNLYYFEGAPEGGRGGALGTLVLQAEPARAIKVLAEFGVGRALGGALEVDVDRPGRRAWAKLRFAPSELPALTIERQSGRQAEAGWTSRGDEYTINATAASRRYEHAAFSHSSNVANVDVQRRLAGGWSIHGGSGYSLFDGAPQLDAKVHNVLLPGGVAFSHPAMGLALDYQFSRETIRDLAGHLVRANVNGGLGRIRFSAFAERETHAPSARYILSEVRWLQPVLDRLGLAATTPQQIADLLRTNAELSAFGYSNSLTIDVTPVRVRAGASGGWAGAGPRSPQLFASVLINRDERIDHATLSGIHSLSYSQRLGAGTELFLTGSALCTGSYFLPSSCQPAMFASLRRTIGSVPGILARREGTIRGVVFKDDEGRAAYAPGMPPISGVEVVLDGTRRTLTDASGRFRFDDVPYGRHRVEARYAADQQLFFTTPSPVDVDADAIVYFGIGRARSRLRGVVLADADTGISGVAVRVAGAERQTTARTAEDGSFVVEGLPAGVYEVTVDAASVPTGYALDALAAQRIELTDTTPGRATFVLKPYRSVSGRARVFDRERGQYVALAGATVELQPIGRRSITDAAGLYTFRDLPAGEYTVAAQYDDRQHSVGVTLPETPAFLKGIDLAVVPQGTVAVVAGTATQPAANRPGSKAAPAPTAVDTTAAANTGRESFTIEVTTSTSSRYARAIVSELKASGHPAYVVKAARAEAPFVVRVGNYVTLAAATSSARLLEKTLGWQLQITKMAPLNGALDNVTGLKTGYR